MLEDTTDFETFKEFEEVRLENMHKMLEFDCIEDFNEFILKECNKSL